MKDFKCRYITLDKADLSGLTIFIKEVYLINDNNKSQCDFVVVIEYNERKSVVHHKVKTTKKIAEFDSFSFINRERLKKIFKEMLLSCNLKEIYEQKGITELKKFIKKYFDNKLLGIKI